MDVSRVRNWRKETRRKRSDRQPSNFAFEKGAIRLSPDYFMWKEKANPIQITFDSLPNRSW